MKRVLMGISCLFVVVAMLTLVSGIVFAKSLTVGVSWSNFQEERWKTDEAAIKNQLKTLGAKYISADAQADSSKQISDVENLIARGCDALISSRTTRTPLIPPSPRPRLKAFPLSVTTV